MKRLLALALLVATLTSCVSNKKLTYLQRAENDTTQFYQLARTDYRLQENDIISINIRSLDMESSNQFNTSGSQIMNQNTDLLFYLNGYTIDIEGNVDVPVLGKIQVEGMTLDEAVHRIGGGFDLFITLHDEKAKKKSGRIYLDDIASSHKVPLLKIDHVNDQETIDALKRYNIGWLFIIGWSQIASKELIETPRKGAIGAHPTLLPVGRGRAAVPWAIIKGLDKTGVSFFKMDEGVDTGELLGQFEIPLSNQSTATELYAQVNEAHTKLIVNIWPSL